MRRNSSDGEKIAYFITGKSREFRNLLKRVRLTLVERVEIIDQKFRAGAGSRKIEELVKRDEAD